MGYTQSDSCSAILPGVFANHSQKPVIDILGGQKLSEIESYRESADAAT
jgi:hypothetical protein